MNQTPTIEFILPKWVIFAAGKNKIRIAALPPLLLTNQKIPVILIEQKEVKQWIT
jgi:hypothetical protein